MGGSAVVPMADCSWVAPGGIGSSRLTAPTPTRSPLKLNSTASHLSGRPARLPVLVTRNSSSTSLGLPATGPTTVTVALKALPRLEASSIAIATAVKARMATTITIRPVGPRSSRLRRPGDGGGGGAVAEGLDTALRLAGRPTRKTPNRGSGVAGAEPPAFVGYHGRLTTTSRPSPGCDVAPDRPEVPA